MLCARWELQITIHSKPPEHAACCVQMGTSITSHTLREEQTKYARRRSEEGGGTRQHRLEPTGVTAQGPETTRPMSGTSAGPQALA